MNNNEMLTEVARKRVPVYGIVFIIYLLVMFHRMAAGIMAPEIVREFAVDPAMAGLLGAIMMYGYAIFNLPSGLITDAVGPRITISIAILLAGIGSFMFGMAGSYKVVLIGRGVVAAGSAVVFAAAHKLFAHWSSRKHFTTMSGALMSWGKLGAIIATTPLAFLMMTFGWRTSFNWIGIISIFIAIVAYFLIKNEPSDVGLLSPDEILGLESEGEKQSANYNPMKDLMKVVTRGRFWILLLYMGVMGGTVNVMLAMWGGLFLQNGLGLSKTIASSVLLCGAIFSLFGGLLAGYIGDRFNNKKGVALIGGCLFVILWGILAFFTESLPLWIIYVIFGYLGFAEVWCITAGYGIVRTMVVPRVLSSTIGVCAFACFLVGAGVITQVWGYIIKGSGAIEYSLQSFHPALIFQWFLLVIGVIALLFVREGLLPGFEKEN